jgi:N-acylneuraminate cytidylyltransferase
MDAHVTAIVPIKEHSERLPRKNFRDFNGRPLYHWILMELDQVEAIDDIVVNTDAEEVIQNAPKLFDVEISKRPVWLRDDAVTTRIVEYEIERCDSDIFVQTYCTNPLLTADTISEALRLFVESPDYDSLLPLTRHNTWFYDADFMPINHDPYVLERTQDMTPVYEDNSVLYIYTEETINKTGHRLGTNPLPFEIDNIEASDIDQLSDFKVAESLHQLRMDEEL